MPVFCPLLLCYLKDTGVPVISSKARLVIMTPQDFISNKELSQSIEFSRSRLSPVLLWQGSQVYNLSIVILTDKLLR